MATVINGILTRNPLCSPEEHGQANGTFQCPGPAYCQSPACSMPMMVMRVNVSLMSPVVRQSWAPTLAPNFQTSSMPYWHKL